MSLTNPHSEGEALALVTICFAVMLLAAAPLVAVCAHYHLIPSRAAAADPRPEPKP